MPVELIHGYIKVDHLEGHPFVHGERDCYTTLQKMYMDNLGIKLSDFARPEDWWTIEGMDLYRQNFESEGFSVVEIADNMSNIRPFDVALIAIPDSRNPNHVVPNHCAIYIGNGEVIHHRMGLLSQRKKFNAGLRNFTMMYIRHKDVPDFSDTSVTKVDIGDYILPHKRQMLMGVTDVRED